MSDSEVRKPEILVIGDVMLDQYWHGGADRLSPEAPVPIFAQTFAEDKLGGAANVAANLSDLGCQVTLLYICGADSAGEKIAQLLKEKGVVGFPIKSKRMTIEKIRVTVDGRQLLRIDREEISEEHDRKKLFDAFKKLISGQEFAKLILSDYNKGALNHADKIIEEARKNKISTLVDPKIPCWDRYRGATLVKPNKREFEIAFGTTSSIQDLMNKAKAALQKYNIESIIVTLGGLGSVFVSADLFEHHFEKKKIDVFDVTGAGDTYLAAYAKCVIENKSSQISCIAANRAAELVIQKMGTTTVTSEQLNTIVESIETAESVRVSETKKARRDVNGSQKIMGRERLLNAVAEQREFGASIGFTNGCFDILHAGHLSLLSEASSYVDFLVVAVDSDRSVTELKGEKRPINSCERRTQALSLLTQVNGLIVFHHSELATLINEVRPDILFKGDDYREQEVVGAKETEAHGGEVMYIKLIDGVSTTKIIEKINLEREG